MIFGVFFIDTSFARGRGGDAVPRRLPGRWSWPSCSTTRLCCPRSSGPAFARSTGARPKRLKSVGMTYWQTMFIVVLPQAVRRMVPAIVAQMATLTKDVSLGFVISYEEFVRRGQATANFPGSEVRNFQAFVVRRESCTSPSCGRWRSSPAWLGDPPTEAARRRRGRRCRRRHRTGDRDRSRCQPGDPRSTTRELIWGLDSLRRLDVHDRVKVGMFRRSRNSSQPAPFARTSALSGQHVLGAWAMSRWSWSRRASISSNFCSPRSRCTNCTRAGSP